MNEPHLVEDPSQFDEVPPLGEAVEDEPDNVNE